MMKFDVSTDGFGRSSRSLLFGASRTLKNDQQKQVNLGYSITTIARRERRARTFPLFSVSMCTREERFDSRRLVLRKPTTFTWARNGGLRSDGGARRRKIKFLLTWTPLNARESALKRKAAVLILDTARRSGCRTNSDSCLGAEV